jgi:hypothetical protein
MGNDFNFQAASLSRISVLAAFTPESMAWVARAILPFVSRIAAAKIHIAHVVNSLFMAPAFFGRDGSAQSSSGTEDIPLTVAVGMEILFGIHVSYGETTKTAEQRRISRIASVPSTMRALGPGNGGRFRDSESW